MPVENITTFDLYRMIRIFSSECLFDIAQLDYVASLADGGIDILESDRKEICNILEILIEKLFLYEKLNFRCGGRWLILHGICRFLYGGSQIIAFQEGGFKEVPEIVPILIYRIIGAEK